MTVVGTWQRWRGADFLWLDGPVNIELSDGRATQISHPGDAAQCYLSPLSSTHKGQAVILKSQCRGTDKAEPIWMTIEGDDGHDIDIMSVTVTPTVTTDRGERKIAARTLTRRLIIEWPEVAHWISPRSSSALEARVRAAIGAASRTSSIPRVGTAGMSKDPPALLRLKRLVRSEKQLSFREGPNGRSRIISVSPTDSTSSGDVLTALHFVNGPRGSHDHFELWAPAQVRTSDGRSCLLSGPGDVAQYSLLTGSLSCPHVTITFRHKAVSCPGGDAPWNYIQHSNSSPGDSPNVKIMLLSRLGEISHEHAQTVAPDLEVRLGSESDHQITVGWPDKKDPVASMPMSQCASLEPARPRATGRKGTFCTTTASGTVYSSSAEASLYSPAALNRLTQRREDRPTPVGAQWSHTSRRSSWRLSEGSSGSLPVASGGVHVKRSLASGTVSPLQSFPPLDEDVDWISALDGLSSVRPGISDLASSLGVSHDCLHNGSTIEADS